MAGLQSFFKEIKKASRGHRIVSVGVEFGSSSIKLVQLIEDKGVVQLGNYGEIDLGPLVGKPRGSVANLDAVKLQEAVTILLNKVPVGDPEAVAVAIPLSATLVIPLELAGVTEKNIESLVKAEIESHIPVPLNEVYIDWQIVEESAKPFNPETKQGPADNQQSSEAGSKTIGSTKVICFVVNKDIISTYQAVLESVGLSIEYFELEVYSVLRSAVPNNIPEALIVDIGARYTKVYGVKNGAMVHAIKKLYGGQDYTKIIESVLQVDTTKAEDLKRSINLGDVAESKVVTSIKKSVDKLVASLESTQAELGISDGAPVYLCGGGTLLFGLPEYLAHSMAAKIIICQPFINTEAPAYLDKLLVETGPEYAVATGLALKHIRTI